MTTLRLATLNLWNKSGPWPQRLELIQREIRRLKPDLLGLQEVLRLAHPSETNAEHTPRTCQAHEVREGFQYRVAYAKASDFGGGLLFGNALLSRYPILEQQDFVLPGATPEESRVLLYACVETPYGELPVFVTHLNWKLHHASIRLEQVRFVAEQIGKLCPVRGPRLPPVLMGDFNADPDSDEMRFLRGLAVVEGKSVYFADAWIYGGPPEPGATFDRQNAFASRAHEPSRRIDYIFVRGPDRLLRGEPVTTALAFNRPETFPEGRVWPSDHFGLVSDIVFEARSP
ncbi:MAG TPA: endonuclease/exonuclease/phosphatase family protein [Polyangiaceae bacterium]|nr:endonuclease/exonuclease/phosphatase family protein [Polyangiaceae bacterium]